MAGRIPRQFIDDLVSRVDIVEIIDERVPLKKAGQDYQALCPFHGEKTPSFTVSARKQFYHCFGCGAHGTAIGFLMDYAHMDFVEAVQALAARVGVSVPSEDGEVRAGPDHGPLYAALERAAEYFRRQLREHPQARRAVDYLKGRGLTGRVAAEFALGYAPPGYHNLAPALGADKAGLGDLVKAGLVVDRGDGNPYDRFRDRIMFPILDRRGRTIAFGGRVLDASTPKYLNSPETPVFHKGRELYGLYQARRQRDLRRLIVVEGYMDVVALAQFGIHGAVATLGTAATAEHLEALFRSAPEVVFCFDGDAAGRRAAWRALGSALPLMREGRQASFMFLPEGADPDTLVRERGAGGFADLLATARPLSGLFFEQLGQGLNLGTLDGRARLVDLARPYLTRIPEGAFRRLMEGRLAEISRMERRELTTLLSDRAASAPVRTPGRSRSRAQAPSLVRRTIALLLHHPELAHTLEPGQRLQGLDLPGMALLEQMLELARASPNLKMAGMIEHFRDTENGRHLDKLSEASFEDIDPEAEFRDAMGRLQAKGAEQRFEALQQRAAAGALNDEEKREYAALCAGFGGGRRGPG